MPLPDNSNSKTLVFYSKCQFCDFIRKLKKKMDLIEPEQLFDLTHFVMAIQALMSIKHC